ncbi:MAG: four helix bundle protein [Chitinophagales bacterium]|nr:four helix bundle protein [Chitinophagales bacterium]
MSSYEKSRLLEDRMIEFSANVSNMIEALPKSRQNTIYATQLSRSSSSVPLNYSEARGAESRRDFIHKLRLVLKELRESYTCLRLIDKTINLPETQKKLLTEANELISIIVVTIGTTKKKL